MPRDTAGVRLNQGSSLGCSDLKALFLSTRLVCLLTVISYREIHLHRGPLPPGATDGLLPDPDVHSQPAHCHPLVDFLLDQHGCGTSPCGPGNHHCAHHDDPELWFPSIPAQGKFYCPRAQVTWADKEGTHLSSLPEIRRTREISHHFFVYCAWQCLAFLSLKPFLQL